MQVVRFEQAKILKEKGFDLQVEYFYTPNGGYRSLIPIGDFQYLHDETGRLVEHFDGKYNWNSVKSYAYLLTDYGEIDPYEMYGGSCACSAPEQHIVVEWLRVNYDIWVEIQLPLYNDFRFSLIDINKKLLIKSSDEFYETPQDACSAAFDYILDNNII